MEYLIGNIELFPYNFVPMGWLSCNGQMVSIMEFQALFAVIGNRYGGDGSSTFALPNMQGEEPIPGLHYLICYEGLFPQQG